MEDFEPIAGFRTAANVARRACILAGENAGELTYLSARQSGQGQLCVLQATVRRRILSGALLVARENIRRHTVALSRRRAGIDADLLRGDVQLMFYQVLPPVLALSRLALCARLPSTSSQHNFGVARYCCPMKETGLDDRSVGLIRYLRAENTPTEIVAKLNADIIRVAAMPEVRQVI